MALATTTTPGSVILGGDLTGVANAPELRITGVTAGTYVYPSVVVDAKGRLIFAKTNNAPTLAGDVTGTLSATSLPITGVAATQYNYVTISVNANGYITAASANPSPSTSYSDSSYTTKGIAVIQANTGLAITTGVLSSILATNSIFGVVKAANSEYLSIVTGQLDVGDQVVTINTANTFGFNFNTPVVDTTISTLTPDLDSSTLFTINANVTVINNPTIITNTYTFDIVYRDDSVADSGIYSFYNVGAVNTQLVWTGSVFAAGVLAYQGSPSTYWAIVRTSATAVPSGWVTHFLFSVPSTNLDQLSCPVVAGRGNTICAVSTLAPTVCYTSVNAGTTWTAYGDTEIDTTVTQAWAAQDQPSWEHLTTNLDGYMAVTDHQGNVINYTYNPNGDYPIPVPEQAMPRGTRVGDSPEMPPDEAQRRARFLSGLADEPITSEGSDVVTGTAFYDAEYQMQREPIQFPQVRSMFSSILDQLPPTLPMPNPEQVYAPYIPDIQPHYPGVSPSPEFTEYQGRRTRRAAANRRNEDRPMQNANTD